ncbi:MAG: hypothetical protein ACJ74Y_10760 [Bryobacteraceae bacterium]
MSKISPKALTDQRTEKSVPHPQVQAERPETKRSGKAAAPGEPVGEQISRGRRSNVGSDEDKSRDNDEAPDRAGADGRLSQRGNFPVRKKRVPVFTHDEMAGVAARALARTFSKPKKKYSR